MINAPIMPEPPSQPDNPTDFQRHILGRYALLQKGRPEDFDYILKLMAPPADITSIAPPGVLKGKRIGIIGAGLAGLSAAFELRKTGAELTIFEAEEKRVGGRVYTYYFDKALGLYGEFGAMRIPVTHETVWHYINLLRLPTRPFVQTNENAFIYLKNTRVRNDAEGRNVMRYIYPKYQLTERERITPWQQLVYEGVENPLLPATPMQRAELLQVRQSYNPYHILWDYTSNRKIMEGQGLSQGAIELISSLSTLAGQNLYQSYIDIAQANYPANLSFLYEIKGGTSVLPNALYRSLLNPRPEKEYAGIPPSQLGRVIFKNGNWVSGIHRDENGKVVLSYKNKSAPHTIYKTFDYVVCAIPFSTLRTVDIHPLFSDHKMQAIREVTYISAQKTLMLCKKRFWEENSPWGQIIGGGSYTDLPITSIWYPSDHYRYCHHACRCYMYSYPYEKPVLHEKHQMDMASEPGVLLASYNYSLDTVRLANMAQNLREEEIKRQVEQVHGLPAGYLDNIAIEFKTMNWNNNIWARGTLTFYSPQQKTLFSYAMAQPEYDSRVFMAGDHISPVHRWMQGALHSGMTAANQLAEAFMKLRASV